MDIMYNYQVDNDSFSTKDKFMDGRQVRNRADLSPASEFQLIQIINGSSRSVGLEEKVEFEHGEIATFRAFKGDRVFSFTLNERGWEWGASTIAAAELRALAAIGDEELLILDGDRDKIIPADGLIKLGAEGVEHIVSERPKTVTIIVNGREHEVDPGDITFEQLLVLAFANPPSGPNIYYTVTFRKGPRQRPEGSLQPSESVRVKEGMIFNVRSTDKS